MSENATQKCRHCYEKISQQAKVCGHCHLYQTRWRALLANLQSLSNLAAIGLLAISVLQFREAREERVKAETAAKAVQQLSLTVSEVLLATSAATKGRFEDFRLLELTAPYVRRKVEVIFNILDLAAPQRQTTLGVYEAYQRWSSASEGTLQKSAAWEDLKRLLQ